MKTTSDLFQLIKSLTKSEKRHFTIFASKHVIGERNNYLKLFKAIDAQEKYDEAALRKQFEGEIFLKQLPVTKNYLYNLILKSMRVYRSSATIEVRLQEMLQDIEFLFEKGMEAQCKKAIIKAKELCYEYQKFRALLIFLEWQRRTTISNSLNDEEIDALYAEEKDVIRKLENLHEYNALSSMIFRMHHKHGRPRTEEDFKKAQEIANHPLLREESTALTEEARVRFYNIRAALAQARGDIQEYYSNSKSLITLLEKNPAHKTEDISRYINMLHNFVDACAQSGNYDELDLTLDKLRSLPADCPNMQARIFSTVATMETNLLFRLGAPNNAEEVLKRVKSDLAIHVDKMSPGEVIILKFNLALSHFILANYREALYWANEVINSDEFQVRKDMYCLGRLFCLIIHYELGNLDYLEYSVKSTYRFLTQRNHLFDFEKATLDFIRRLPRIQSQSTLIEAFKELRTQLLKISTENPFQQTALYTFEFLPWLESKIENVPLLEIINRRADQRKIQLQAAA
ncbi:MAG TPA: hypothetical protein VEC36_04995 [Patescibacteria group bacterium]|nr:hypothetical protein [Patescibacteria group bacterium]